MLSDIKGIKFEGAAFDNETILQIFSQSEADRISLIFGRNGSGKSTISRAVAQASGSEDVEDIISAKFVDSSNTDVTISEDEKKCIFVFNEDYTNSRVRFKEDGLSTIVMFGDVVDIAEQIEKATEELDKAEKDHKEQIEKYSPYVNSNSIQSPENQYEKVKAKLKGDKSWADRERLIMDSKANAAVTDNVISEIMKEAPIESKQDLLSTYDMKYSLLQFAKSSGTKVTDVIPTVNDYVTETKLIVDLLAEKVEEPTLTDREKALLLLAQSGKQSMLVEMKAEFSSKTDTCPFCLQSITDEYKSELIKSIEKILSKDAQEHSEALKKSKIQPVSIDLSVFELVDKTTVISCRQAVITLNVKIAECNEKIDQKIANLYTPITQFTPDLHGPVDILKTQLSELEKKKQEYNDRIGTIQKAQKNLKVLNGKLAHYEIKDVYADFLTQKSEKESEKVKLDKLALEFEKAKNKLSDLNQQKKNVKIAVDFINKGLQYVFFSSDKLKVIVSGDNYTLLSNNKPVKPKNISVGERNILALCYFFTELLNNMDEKKVHSAECIVVLDDPVSSFDLENRIGIISYLKSQILKILRGNLNSKIVLLSHDLLTIYDVDKALEEIANQIRIKVNDDEKKMVYRLLDLDKRELTVFSRKKRNEYSQLLKTVYEYASNKSNEYELVIGNIMRRMLEAFGTFEYRKGIDEISCDQTILSIIDEEKREYFENLMYRLVLNGDSHLEERTKSLTDNNFFATITADEKKRTAKDVLCLMYLLNGNHIKAQFHAIKDEVGTDVVGNIEKWINDIAQNDEVTS